MATIQAKQDTRYNEANLHQLLNQSLVEFGAAMNAPLILIGDKLGLYKTIASDGPLSTRELAEKTGTVERYVREWIRAQAASGFVSYDEESDRYSMSEEQALLFADEESPMFVIGGFQAALAAAKSYDNLLGAFQNGNGVGWHEHDCGLFHGTERFFKPAYTSNLISSWLPALKGMTAKLEAGIRVADVGCGHGAALIIMAQEFSNSTFVGIDYHNASIEAARQKAADAGVSDRVSFYTTSAQEFYSDGYDLITTFDALHDMGDPVGAAANVLRNLNPGGSWMIVEPQASDRVSENLNPLGRALYAASTMFCTPNALNQEVGMALGAQAGEGSIREVVTIGGFTQFKRVAETPFNMVFEAKP